MAINRADRLNSLLVQVISDVILKEVKNPHLPPLLTITRVDITNDLRHAKVYVSVIGDEVSKKKAVEVLQQASGFIATKASKQVTMRFFPELTFYLDLSVDKQARVDEILAKIHLENKEKKIQEKDE